jgi:hypothetical protein
MTDITLSDGKELVITPDYSADDDVTADNTTFTATIINPNDNTIIYKIANAAMHDILNSKTITGVLNAHGFDEEAIQSALRKALNVNVAIPINDDVSVDVGMNAGDDPGVHVGVDIKF